jgi:hypothetical protein
LDVGIVVFHDYSMPHFPRFIKGVTRPSQVGLSELDGGRCQIEWASAPSCPISGS